MNIQEIGRIEAEMAARQNSLRPHERCDGCGGKGRDAESYSLCTRCQGSGADPRFAVTNPVVAEPYYASRRVPRGHPDCVWNLYK